MSEDASFWPPREPPTWEQVRTAFGAQMDPRSTWCRTCASFLNARRERIKPIWVRVRQVKTGWAWQPGVASHHHECRP